MENARDVNICVI